MKTAVSIPDDVFEKVERFARRARKSRSEVFSDALREYVGRHAPDEVVESINKVCDTLGQQDDEFVRTASRRGLEKTEWWLAGRGVVGRSRSADRLRSRFPPARVSGPRRCVEPKSNCDRGLCASDQ